VKNFASFRDRITAFIAEKRGVALIEFAYGLPIFLAFGFCCIEVANLATTRMRLSQITLQLADNASRVGTSNGLMNKRVFESDIYDIFEGARLQSGTLNLNQRGRMIISSLQRNAAGGQWIAWQRCMGSKTSYAPTYGSAGTGRTVTTYAGMGPAGSEVQAPAAGAVMFVEVAYDYRALVEPVARGMTYFGMNTNNQTLVYRAAFIVRDPRVLGLSTASTTTAEDYGLFQDATPRTRLTC
jgi:hypothetical protein